MHQFDLDSCLAKQGKYYVTFPQQCLHKSLVTHQASLAKQAGLDALVCSPYEINAVRKIFKKEIITPGVQIGKRNYDQKRSMEAKKVKSDWLVIGRAITRGNIKRNIQKLFQELK